MMVYQWCVENKLPVLVHHNANYFHHDASRLEARQVGVYADEIMEVLQKFPDLVFCWMHCGISRSCFNTMHHLLIGELADMYPNIYFDISWVVYETTICKPRTYTPKPEWLNLFEKYPTRFYMGSDCVGQFESIDGENLYAPQQVKYHELLTMLTDEARDGLAWRNSERLFFEGWKVPTYAKTAAPKMPGECLVINEKLQTGSWVPNGELY
jgi:predicted TIM-barrel fold metal-dependent hydrolase